MYHNYNNLYIIYIYFTFFLTFSRAAKKNSLFINAVYVICNYIYVSNPKSEKNNSTIIYICLKKQIHTDSKINTFSLIDDISGVLKFISCW